jgi:hypothetical protein
MRLQTSAIAEYQKILDHRGTDPCAVEYTLSHLGLGRAYALQRTTATAKSAYQDFFAVWKDADPDIPILKSTRSCNSSVAIFQPCLTCCTRIVN